MRQIGILAAAGLYALKNNINRLAEDHKKAKILAETIAEIPSLEIDINSVQTNIIMFKSGNLSVEEALDKSKSAGVLISEGRPGFLRVITHLDVSNEEIEKTRKIFREIFS